MRLRFEQRRARLDGPDARAAQERRQRPRGRTRRNVFRRPPRGVTFSARSRERDESERQQGPGQEGLATEPQDHDLEGAGGAERDLDDGAERGGGRGREAPLTMPAFLDRSRCQAEQRQQRQGQEQVGQTHQRAV